MRQIPSPSLRDEAATRTAEDPGTPGEEDLKIQSQFAKGADEVKLNVSKGLREKSRFRVAKKQSQSPAFGRKSEARNPKS